MIAFDTNVLVRLLIQDDAAQAARAELLLSEAIKAGETCFISEAVLCELEWVLTSCYKARRTDFALTVENLMMDPTFVLQDREVVQSALASFMRGKADFSDYLIGAKALAEGARSIYTFDRALRNEKGFVVVA